MKTPEEIVQEQLEYYNNHDIEGFISTYSPNIKIYNMPSNTPILEGHEEMRERYTKRFASPDLKATIKNRMINGNFVVDFESVTGIEKDSISEVIAIYEVYDGLIQNVWFLRK
jgi:hypothetical protein